MFSLPLVFTFCIYFLNILLYISVFTQYNIKWSLMPEKMETKIAFTLTWIAIKVEAQDLREQLMGMRANIKQPFCKGVRNCQAHFSCAQISCQLSNVFSHYSAISKWYHVYLCICTINYCILADMEIAQMIVITPAAIPAIYIIW